jgi:hypothetical protein
VKPGAARQCARAERAEPADEIKAFEICALEVEASADVVVEQGQLNAHIAQRVSDRTGQASAVIVSGGGISRH